MKKILGGVGSGRFFAIGRLRGKGASDIASLVTVLCLIASAHSQSNPGTYEVLHTFTNSPDGGHPMSGLLRDTQGNLYGTTSAGGNTSAACNNNYCGVVFKIDSAGNEAVVYSFSGQPDGSNPVAGLIQDSAGNLYGTTSSGGATGHGTIFKLDPSRKETVLYSFAGQPDGSSPNAGLVLDAVGNLYGTTTVGGASNQGAIFKLDTSGNETVLYSFTGAADGGHPNELIQDSAGNLYGTANSGGLQNCIFLRNVTLKTGCGTVFKLDASGAFTLLYSFQSDIGPDGARPLGSLIADTAGNLYGTTMFGGQPACSVSSPGSPPKAIGCGTIFKFDTAGNEKVLHLFSALIDGGWPQAGLVSDTAGNLYGTTLVSVFEFDTSGNLNVLSDFTGGADGGSSYAPLLRDSAGNLYGAATSGGDLNCHCGVVFELPATTSPVFNVSVAFTGGGTGTVTSTPGGINCTTDCASAFPVGTSVTLTATPTPGSTFGGWSGGGLSSSCNNNTCTMNSAQAFIATFNPPQPDFTVSASAFTPAAVSPGSTSTTTITTAAIGGFSGQITLSCTVQSSIPFAPTCSVSPTSVNAGTSAKVTVSTTGPTGSMESPYGSGTFYAAWLPILGLLMGSTGLLRQNRIQKVRLRLACLLVASALLQMACGGSSTKFGSGGTPAGTYTVVVTGVSGSLQHSVSPNPTVTVQ